MAYALDANNHDRALLAHRIWSRRPNDSHTPRIRDLSYRGTVDPHHESATCPILVLGEKFFVHPSPPRRSSDSLVSKAPGILRPRQGRSRRIRAAAAPAPAPFPGPRAFPTPKRLTRVGPSVRAVLPQLHRLAGRCGRAPARWPRGRAQRLCLRAVRRGRGGGDRPRYDSTRRHPDRGRSGGAGAALRQSPADG